MALTFFDHLIIGLSSDAKPTLHPNTGEALGDGWSFGETDTNKLFRIAGGAWSLCVNLSGAIDGRRTDHVARCV